jgi:hypothetical protein
MSHSEATTVPKAACAGTQRASSPTSRRPAETYGWHNAGPKAAVHGPEEQDGFVSVLAEVPDEVHAAESKRRRMDESAESDDSFWKECEGTFNSAELAANLSRIEVAAAVAKTSLGELYSLVRRYYLPAMAREFEARNRAVLYGLDVKGWRLDLFDHHQGDAAPVTVAGHNAVFGPKSYPKDLRVYPGLMDILCDRELRCRNIQVWCRMCDDLFVQEATYLGDLREFNQRCQLCGFPSLVVPCYFDGYLYYYSDFVNFDDAVSGSF